MRRLFPLLRKAEHRRNWRDRQKCARNASPWQFFSDSRMCSSSSSSSSSSSYYCCSSRFVETPNGTVRWKRDERSDCCCCYCCRDSLYVNVMRYTRTTRAFVVSVCLSSLATKRSHTSPYRAPKRATQQRESVRVGRSPRQRQWRGVVWCLVV